MRILAFPLLALAMVGLLGLPAAFADGADDTDDDGTPDHAQAGMDKRAEHARGPGTASHGDDNDTDDNETDDGNNTHAQDGRARGAAARAEHEGGLARPAHVLAFVERLHEIRAAWHENATSIREECRAQTFDHENATGTETRAYAHCIRDGYADMRAWLKSELLAAREDFRAARGGSTDS